MTSLMSKQKVAATIGVSLSTIWRWTRSGHFPKSIRLGPNRVGWLETDISSWIEARRALSSEKK